MIKLKTPRDYPRQSVGVHRTTAADFKLWQATGNQGWPYSKDKNSPLITKEKANAKVDDSARNMGNAGIQCDNEC